MCVLHAMCHTHNGYAWSYTLVFLVVPVSVQRIYATATQLGLTTPAHYSHILGP